MEFNRSVDRFKALADASRLRLVRALQRGDQYVEELAKRLELAPSTVSFHLKKLENAGLVYGSREQYYAVYRLNHGAMGLSLADLIAGNSGEEAIEVERIRRFHRSVVNTFMPDGHLLKIPTPKKKRRIVLELLAQEFRPERLYTEAEVNHRLIGYFDDYCTLRRLLVDEGLMQRRDGLYWLSGPRPEAPATDALQPESGSAVNDTRKETTMDRRRQLVRAYKEREIPMGVYCVRNRENGKMLVGSYPNLHAILNRVRAQLRFGVFPNAELQADWNSLGEEQFDFEILDRLEIPKDERDKAASELKLLEEMWLAKLKPYGERGYNK
ncbi:metalloregulator ArsR/SmtB family transcription factor [candidate division KSB1 bacterium]|nr:metalloregulator ArsR/SmtB family transcription factor [candidate division KSB1 bacterium]